MFVGDERLDAARRAHEQHHDDDAAEHEKPVKQARADRAEPQQSGDRPAAGERGAEHFGTDEDGRADDGQHVLPEDAARPLRRGRVQSAALSSKLGPDSRRTPGGCAGDC
jgi:hypothetical protein